MALEEDAKNLLNSSGHGRKSKKQALKLASISDSHKKIDSEVTLLSATQRKLHIEAKAKEVGLQYNDIDDLFKASTKLKIGEIEADIKAARLIQSIKDNDPVNFIGALFNGIDPNSWENRLYKNEIMNSDFGSFSDLVGSATGNKILGAGNNNGFFGHDNAYYKNRRGEGKQTESFANMTALLGRNSNLWSVVIYKFFPNLTKIHKEILTNE